VSVATASNNISVRRVQSKQERADFIRFPWKVMKNDPCWVPPLVMDRQDFLDRKKHPFYLHGDAELLLATRGSEVVGRILVSEDPRYNEVHKSKVCCFGMFDAIDDPQVAKELFDAAEAWGKARGLTEMLGPIDYSSNYELGLLIDGFDTPPRVMMKHNPRYYQGLFEASGFTKAKDLYAYWITSDKDPPQRWRDLAERMAKRGGVTIRPAEMKNFASEVGHIKRIYNEAWEDNWGFVKMTDAEFDHLAKDLKMLLRPELALIAEVKGEPVGFSLALPDLNEALAHLPNGKLTTLGLPIGLGKLLYWMKKIHTLRLVILGVLPGYRRRGITELLILQTYDVGRSLGFNACEMGWTLEDNDLINKPIEALGSERYKSYRLYQRPIKA